MHYAVIIGVLMVQRKGLFVLVPILLSYMPTDREAWAYVITTFWWWAWYFLSFRAD